MAQFPSAEHLASWAGLAPGNEERAGKRRSGKTTKGHKWLRRTFTQAAWAATRRQAGDLAAQYRRLAARRGKKRAIVALGQTILVAAYHMLKDEGDSRDLGADYFDRRQRERPTAHLVSRLHGLGYEVKLEPIGNQAASRACAPQLDSGPHVQPVKSGYRWGASAAPPNCTNAS